MAGRITLLKGPAGFSDEGLTARASLSFKYHKEIRWDVAVGHHPTKRVLGVSLKYFILRTVYKVGLLDVGLPSCGVFRLYIVRELR